MSVRRVSTLVSDVRSAPAQPAADRPPAWWVVAAAAVAPTLLIGGWIVADMFQPSSYRWMRDTISALARIGAPDRWFMTAAFAGLGVCYLIIAVGLRAAARPGRALMFAGGVATIMVSALPLPPVGTSPAHGMVALVGFVVMAIWPIAGAQRGGAVDGTPWALRLPVAAAATATLLLFDGWFGLSLLPHALVGVSERATAGAEALWPLVVVISTRATRWSFTPVPRASTAGTAFDRVLTERSTSDRAPID
jgi:hypothetical membrane protein